MHDFCSILLHEDTGGDALFLQKLLHVDVIDTDTIRHACTGWRLTQPERGRSTNSCSEPNLESCGTDRLQPHSRGA